MRSLSLVGLALLITTCLGCVLPEAGRSPRACKNQKISIDPIKVFPLAYVRDHREDKTPESPVRDHRKRVEIIITADLGMKGHELILSGTVSMEANPDDRKFRSRYEKKVTAVGSVQHERCQVENVDMDKGELRAKTSPDNHDWTKYQGNDLIKEATCLSDAIYDDKGKVGCTIVFQTVTARYAGRR